MNLTTVTILGSCVSRDVFNLRQDRYSVVLNIQRNSIKTLYGNALDFPEEVYNCAGNGWNARMLKYNAQKEIPGILAEKPSDYIVIDLVEDRFNIASFAYNGKDIMMPHYLGFQKFVESLTDGDGNTPFENFKSIPPESLGEDFLNDCIEKAATLLTKIYRQEQIIINEFMLLERYADNDLKLCEYPNRPGIGKMNAHLRTMYEKLEKALPRAHVIKMPQNTLGDPNHLWGLAYSHAEKSFYEYVLSCIDIITRADHFSTLEKMYAMQSRENLLRLRTIERIENL